jgi:hypothetical protein
MRDPCTNLPAARRSTFKRVASWAGATLLVLALLVGLVLGEFVIRFQRGPPPAEYSVPSDAADARRQDLDYLRRLPESRPQLLAAGPGGVPGLR